MSILSIFEFESQEVRFVDGKPVANDVAAALGYKDPANAVTRKVFTRNKHLVEYLTPGGIQQITVLEEAGIYQLIFSSKLPSAEKFQDWVFNEVLPSIRKTGTYSITQKPKTQIQLLAEIATQMAQQEQLLLEQDQRITAVEAEQERYNYPNGRFHTVMGFANLQGIKITANEASRKGRLASKLCRKQGISVERIYDPRFGKVGMYPEEILVEVFKCVG